MKKTWIRSAAAAMGMLVLILDTKTAINAGQTAISLCLMTVIPTLFPFFLLSGLLSAGLLGKTGGSLSRLGRLLKIPSGSESLFLVGILGGYPAGAKAVADAYHNRSLSKKDASRMLGFCSNAGPSFVFGIAGAQFTSGITVLALWLIHILSALCVGSLLPGGQQDFSKTVKSSPITLPQALKNSILTTAYVCGWILLFRVVFAYFSRWFLWLLPREMEILICGLLEITIGTEALKLFPGEWIRFMIAGIILAFGGICVTMQTLSITGSLGMGMYLPGKALQCCFCMLFSWIFLLLTENLTCPAGEMLGILVIFCAIIALMLGIGVSLKKRSGNFRKLRV